MDGAPAQIRVVYVPEPDVEVERSLTPWSGLTFEFLDKHGNALTADNPNPNFDPTVGYDAVFVRES